MKNKPTSEAERVVQFLAFEQQTSQATLAMAELEGLRRSDEDLVPSILHYLRLWIVAARTLGAGTGGADALSQFMLANGHAFTPAPLPEKIGKGVPRSCYFNSIRLARLFPDEYLYVEGFGVTEELKVIPIEHGFCIDRAWRVVDPTWEKGIEYFGFPVRHSFLNLHLLAVAGGGIQGARSLFALHATSPPLLPDLIQPLEEWLHK